MSVSALFLLLLAVLALVLVGCVVVAVIVLRRRNHAGSIPPSRSDEPMRVEHAERVERISREIEKINGMQESGRISAAEAVELKAALEGERRAWTDSGTEFVRQSGTACANLAKKRLTKSNNAVFAGVCGGLAEWLGCDATLVRIVYVLLALFMAAFPGIILYLILWLVMPPPETALVADVSGDTPPTPSATGKPRKGCIILLCLVIVPVILALLAALFFFTARSGTVRSDVRAPSGPAMSVPVAR